MITAVYTDMPVAQDKALRDWLQHPSRDLLLEVARSKQKQHLVAAFNGGVEAGKFPLKLDEANAELRRAQDWQVFIDLLNTIATQQAPYSTVCIN